MERRTTGGLLGLHIFTGVDSTSAFVGKEKKESICTVQAICRLQLQRVFHSLGQIWDVLCASFTDILATTSTKHGSTFFV